MNTHWTNQQIAGLLPISRISEVAKMWVASAADATLRAKLEEYADLAGNLSPRDAEMRLQLASAIRAELARRAPEARV